VHVCVHRDDFLRMFVNVCVCTVFLKKQSRSAYTYTDSCIVCGSNCKPSYETYIPRNRKKVMESFLEESRVLKQYVNGRS
jgi:hypothetical protein